MQTIRIGTRGSQLALAQAGQVASSLPAVLLPGTAVEIKVIKTSGDIRPDLPLAAAEGKGLFVKELEEALLAGAIDLAVHSLKDMPARLPRGLVLCGPPRRQDVRDALILPAGKSGGLQALPAGAKIGTGSVRRQGYLLAERPDLTFAGVRGNIDTRLAKLDRGEMAALILACAGLRRLGLAGRISLPLDPEVFVPQAGQGALALEVREKDTELRRLLARLEDGNTGAAVTAERAFLAKVEMGCTAPLGCYGRVEGGELILTARLCDPGRGLDRTLSLTGKTAEAAALGEKLGRRLLDLLQGKLQPRAGG